MTRLATDVDRIPAGFVGFGLRIVVLAQIGRVTIGAHQVPVLIDLGPVQRVGGLNSLVSIDVEPAFLVGVPGRAQRLQPATRELNQVLLQRSDAKGVFDFEIC